MARIRKPRFRRLTPAERALAHEVFGTADDAWLDRVMISSLIGWRGRAFVLPVTRHLMVVNLGPHADDPLSARTPAYPAAGQLLVHELTHAWQFTHARGVLRMFAGAVREQIRYLRGVDVYSIAGTVGGPDEALTLEQQATIVDRWFSGAGSPTGTPMDPDGPHMPFIERLRD